MAYNSPHSVGYLISAIMHGFTNPRGYICALFEAQKTLCFHCNEPMIFVRSAGLQKSLMATREHIYPLGLNGKSMHHNIVLAHAACNHKRGCQNPTEEELIKTSAIYARMGLTAFIPDEEWATNPAFHKFEGVRMAKHYTSARERMRDAYKMPTLADLWPK